jgi:hypothetical protein
LRSCPTAWRPAARFISKLAGLALGAAGRAKHKGAVKMHTLLDLHGNIPTFISITDGKVHDVNILDDILPEAGAFYVMDRGYVDFERL